MVARQRKAAERPPTDSEITLDRLVESSLLSGYDVKDDSTIVRLGVAKPEGIWFKDQTTGMAFRVTWDSDGGFLQVMETRESKLTRAEASKRVTIKCEDCGADREVATQDAHQVKRCLDCQKKYRYEKRRARAKIKRAEKRQARELAKLNGEEPIVEVEDEHEHASSAVSTGA